MLHKTQKSGIKTEPKFPNKKRHQMEACPPNSAGETIRNKQPPTVIRLRKK